MSRLIANIVQINSPTDELLVLFALAALDLESVANITISIGLSTKIILENSESESELRETLAEFQGQRCISELTVLGYNDAPETRQGPSRAHFQKVVTVNGTTKPNLIFAEFYFSRNASTGIPAPSFGQAIYKLILEIFTSETVNSETLGDDGAFGIALTQMASASGEITRKLSEARIEQERRTTEALEKIDEQRIALEEKLSSDRAEMQARNKARETELKKLEDSLESASARHERRTLRSNITQDVKLNLDTGLGDSETTALTALILVIATAAAVACVWFAFQSFFEFTEVLLDAEGNPRVRERWASVALLIRGSLSFFAGLAFAYWLLGYIRSRTESALARRDRLERFALDIDRASWMIETIMELKEEDGVSNVPTPWLEGAAFGLFQEAGTTSEKSGETPMTALSELLSSGASLSLANGGAELKLDPRAAKKIAKSQD